MTEGFLTTHVLDTANGIPAAGLKITLYALGSDTRRILATVTTNDDGRTDTPILPKGEFVPGTYELVFEAGAYFATRGQGTTNPAFLDTIPIRFGISEPDAHYHVPLLVSPFSYSTYRGS